MLNELNQLSKSLTNAGINPPNWHKDLKPLPNASNKNPCYKIIIAPDGTISDIHEMTEVSHLKKWQFGSNGFSFPGFSIKPLYTICSEDENKVYDKWRKGKEQIDFATLNIWCTESNRTEWNIEMINDCLWKVPKELEKICNNIPQEFIALQNLFERIFQHWGENGSDILFKQLNMFFLKELNRLNTFLPILVNPKTENISVFLDINDWADYPVAHEKTITWINLQLFNAGINGETDTKLKPKLDAFGTDCTGEDEKLPEVKLPLLGAVKLRAMNSESPCQFRYGTIDAKSFLIGNYSRMQAKSALEWLGAPEREGDTWGRADGKEIVFSYPASIPQRPVKLAALFGASRADDSAERFESYASDVINCLYGLGTNLRNIELHVFSLRKMDKARTKIVFQRNYTAQRLEYAAKEWQQGCSNIPPIQVMAWGKEKGKSILATPEVPFPIQIADCLNRIWKMDGVTKCSVKTFPITVGIELLLDETSVSRLVPHMIATAVINARGLFLSLGNKLHSNQIISIENVNKNKIIMPSVLGLLLWKIGIRKEQYMNEVPYLVGRLFKVADELHALYCKEVRKNSLPPQLLGNALMASALESPTQAIAQLAMRIIPYLAWAKTNTTPSAGLSRYFLKEFGEIEPILKNTKFPGRLDDAAKAQMFLGYVSNSSQKEETTSN